MHRPFAAAATLVLLACSESQPNHETGTPPVAAHAGPDAATASTLDDGQIVGVLRALNEAETLEARLASTAATRPAVAAFADQVVTDQTNADASLTRGAAASIAPADSSLRAQIRSKMSQDLATLKSQNGATFDRTYVTVQIADREAALAFLDRLLARYASNAALADSVRAARELVTDQLANADALAEVMR